MSTAKELQDTGQAASSSDRASGGRPRVVIVGGGFGGLRAAKALRRTKVDVTLIDRRNFHLFQPLLYQVATGGLSPANIATPFRWALRRVPNVDVLLAEVSGFDTVERRVLLEDRSIPYDYLVVAAGARHSYFGNNWETLAPGLKTVEDAIEMRRRVLLAFEHADRERDPAKQAALLTFVIAGAGPTGVELAGALAEISRHTLKHDFRHIDSAQAKILLVDAVDRVLAAYDPTLSASASTALEELGVSVLLETRLTAIRDGEVTLEARGQSRVVPCETVLWAAGVQASPLGARLAEQTKTTMDRAGRLEVEPDLTLPGHPEISAIGDLAVFRHGLDRPLPGVAPVAMQQGEYVAARIRRMLDGRPSAPFAYRDRGTLATIGRGRAVAQIGRAKFTGLPAWLLWLFVHIMKLTQAESRILVFLQWAWSDPDLQPLGPADHRRTWLAPTRQGSPCRGVERAAPSCCPEAAQEAPTRRACSATCSTSFRHASVGRSPSIWSRARRSARFTPATWRPPPIRGRVGVRSSYSSGST